MNFQSMKEMPKKNMAPAKKPDQGGAPNYQDQIHELIDKGYTVKEIHAAIDAHPDMFNKDAFKVYAAHIHKPRTEHNANMKSSKPTQKE